MQYGGKCDQYTREEGFDTKPTVFGEIMGQCCAVLSSSFGNMFPKLLTLKLLRDRSKFKIKYCFPFSFTMVEFLVYVFSCFPLALGQRKYTYI